MTQKTDAGKVMDALEAGGSVRWFFTQGGAAVCKPDGSRNPDVTCSYETSWDLMNRNLIVRTEPDVPGYPHFADNHRSSVYRTASKNDPAP